MFKVSFYVKKHDEISARDFTHYWLGEHADLAREVLPKLGVRQYLKCEVLHDHPLTLQAQTDFGTGPIRYDFVDHWICNDLKELKHGTESESVRRLMAKVFASEDRNVDIAASNVQMSVDLVQFFPIDANEIRATGESPYLKIYYVVRSLPHIDPRHAQLHWNACHGGESRQHIRYSRQKKYIQAHGIDSTFVDQLIAQRGYESDPYLIGHAEGWIDPCKPPCGFSEEDAARVNRMTMDDIDLFSDKPRGNVFFAREHYIMDEEVVVRPNPNVNDKLMPEFFSAVY